MEFYDWKRTLSYNRRFNLIVSARGYGKTYGMRMQSIRDWEKRKTLFCEIVRTKDEIKPVADGYFDKVNRNEFGGAYQFDFDTTKRTMYVSKDGETYHPIGYIVAMTEEQFLKKISNSAFVDGDKVRRFILDEGIIEKGDRYHRYLPREWATIGGIMSTVARDTPGNPSKAHLYVFGNAIDLTCPIFEGMGINRLPNEYGYHLYGANTLLHYVDPYAQDGFESETLAGIALAGTAEGEKLFGNAFDGLDRTDDIARKSSRARFWHGFQWRGKKFGLWIDLHRALVFVNGRIPKGESIFAMTLDDDTVNYTLIKRSSPIIRQLGEFFYGKLYRYEDAQIRAHYADMLMSLGAI